MENMPTILKTLHEQMDVQKEQKTSVEKDIETLSRYLKTIVIIISYKLKLPNLHRLTIVKLLQKPEEICNG